MKNNFIIPILLIMLPLSGFSQRNSNLYMDISFGMSAWGKDVTGDLYTDAVYANEVSRSHSLSYSMGYKWRPLAQFGAGISWALHELDIGKPLLFSDFSVPIYGEIKGAFEHWRVSPSYDVEIGTVLKGDFNPAISEDRFHIGFYTQPTVGLRFRHSNKISSVLGYGMEYRHFWRAAYHMGFCMTGEPPPPPEKSRRRLWRNMVLKWGISF